MSGVDFGLVCIEEEEKNLSKQYVLALSVLAFAVAGSANAAYNVYEVTAPAFQDGGAAGKVNWIKASHGKTDNDFAWYANFGTANNGKKTDGFWLAVSPGQQPKGTNNELALFYFDANAKAVTAYAYNGVNGDNSWSTPGDKIVGSKALAPKVLDLINITVSDNADGSRTLGFRADISKIRNAKGNSDWTGAYFADTIGYWFHPVTGLNASYASDGFLSSWGYKSAGWVDTPGAQGTVCKDMPVPEPTSIAALGAGVALLARRRRK